MVRMAYFRNARRSGNTRRPAGVCIRRDAALASRSHFGRQRHRRDAAFGRLRRGDRGRRVRRALHAASAAHAGIIRTGLRGRQRRRRHLVLESLSGRALRRREHGIFLSVLRGAAAAVGMDGTLRRPAGDPAVRQPRRGKIRSVPRHSIRHARDGGELRRDGRPLADQNR